MRRTLSEMQRSGQSATNQMWQAIENVNWLARTMKNSLDSSEAHSAEDRRPYVTIRPNVSRMPFEITADRPIFINMQTVNWGRSLAVNLTTRGKVTFGHDAKSLIDPYFSQLPKLPSDKTHFFAIPYISDSTNSSPSFEYITIDSRPFALMRKL
jgi:hypothetical protein